MALNNRPLLAGRPLDSRLFLSLLAPLLHRGLHTNIQPLRLQFPTPLQGRLLLGHGQFRDEPPDLRLEEQKL